MKKKGKKKDDGEPMSKDLTPERQAGPDVRILAKPEGTFSAAFNSHVDDSAHVEDKALQNGSGNARSSLGTQEVKIKAIELLNKIMAFQLAAVVRYTHYSLMVYGPSRIPIIQWLRDQARNSLKNAEKAGEFVTQLGGHPLLAIGPLLETDKHEVEDILRECLENERHIITLYKQLYDVVRNRSFLLEDFTRNAIRLEEQILGDVDKMLRKPGRLDAFVDDFIL
eukprot:CAMPEP_0196663960 /NCGR_PEP_ID=MMETSP1086-20130531/54941_1 /TAXON_ID=77921 /ORGANISM="Cyanoptyche  gloeocystis , Strain SAG4.97" /LENGTH=223 /DNA_ID=CAMNT_0041999993 /DNA_START=193 /DNA_END=864 /DNA_ORIENTATION=+